MSLYFEIHTLIENICDRIDDMEKKVNKLMEILGEEKQDDTP